MCTLQKIVCGADTGTTTVCNVDGVRSGEVYFKRTS